MSTLRVVKVYVALILITLSLGLIGRSAALLLPGADRAKPRLVLFVVVDQLRPDVLEQVHPRFRPGGFRRVIEGGTWFAEARCGHFPSLTSVGHAVLFTGARTAEHGIAANDWADLSTGERVYSLEDPSHSLIGRAPRLHEGVSPRLLGSTTIGDEIVLASGGGARVFAVSLKDRAAILGAGRMGKAFWFATDSGEFVTSTYYYDAYPNWVTAWNREKRAGQYASRSWDLDIGPGPPVRAKIDDRPAEKGYKKLGRTFPHILPADSGPALFDQLTYTPFGDELTVDFIEALLDAERLGQGPGTDMLAVGLTATDFIGHAFGPASLEYEDQVVRLDRLLARLFDAADRRAGRGRTLIVLASDHGVDEPPEVWAEKGWEAGRLDTEAIRGRLNAALRARFGVSKDLVAAFWTPAFFLDERAVSAAKLSVEAVESAGAELLRKEPGVAWALTRTDLLAGRAPAAPILQSVLLSVHPNRTGHIVVVQKPHWYLYEDTHKYSAMHGSPYAYDVRVPLGFEGLGIPVRRVYRPVELGNVAATVAAMLGIAPPSGSTGAALEEPLDGGRLR
jgi:predicted AlkP superfamily pyrophosphatase or phosphodiesterase